MDIPYLILTGMCVGFMSSFFGIGGGSLIMPILYMLYPEVPAQAIIPSSLGVIFFNTLINNYHFKKEFLSPSKQTIINFAITCTLGAGAGASLIHLVNSQDIKKIFAIILIFIAIKVLTTRERNNNLQLEENQFKLGITGFCGSIISSITGLGGGIVFVPMLVSLVKLPLKYISPYSNMAMSFATLIGVFPHLFYPLKSKLEGIYAAGFIGHVNIVFIILIFTGSVLTSKIGARLNTRVDFRIKKKLLAFLLIVFAIKTLF